MSLFKVIALAMACLSLAAAFPYKLTVYLRGDPIDGKEINMAGRSLLLGIPGPASYCPLSVARASACPPGNLSLFVGSLTPWYGISQSAMRRIVEQYLTLIV
jgi:hypothetical protein